MSAKISYIKGINNSKGQIGGRVFGATKTDWWIRKVKTTLAGNSCDCILSGFEIYAEFTIYVPVEGDVYHLRGTDIDVDESVLANVTMHENTHVAANMAIMSTIEKEEKTSCLGKSMTRLFGWRWKNNEQCSTAWKAALRQHARNYIGPLKEKAGWWFDALQPLTPEKANTDKQIEKFWKDVNGLLSAGNREYCH